VNALKICSRYRPMVNMTEPNKSVKSMTSTDKNLKLRNRLRIMMKRH